MYTSSRVSEYPNRTTKGQALIQKKISKEKTGEIPMKALLRSSIFALFVFAGYAAVATDISKPHTNAGFPPPCNPPVSIGHISK
jgi:hypothetical protein